MKILSSPQHINKELKRLTRSYSRYLWATAWASTSYKDGFSLLKQNRDKIKRLVVGIHFYQTHPDFINEFIETDTVKFVMNPDGVFHPKIYLFENENRDWECIIGSPNFTGSAFTGNSEVAVLITSRDIDAVEAYQELIYVIEQYWYQGKYLTTDDLVSYRNVWKRKQKSLNKISGQYGTSGRVKKSPMDVSVFKMSWQAFFQRTKNDSEHTLEGRLKVLNTARNLFESYIHFKNMDIDTRRGIAGFGPEEEVHWHWFGSTTAAGNFKHAVIENDEHISLALDQIPLQGDVTENHYIAYVKKFEHIKGGGVATATRLLALKRPDYFICLNNQNKNGLCTAFEIPKHVTLSNYWEVVIERITDSVWWSSKEPTNVTELAVWKYRAAFLDVLFYVPS